jgi:hypothetical protein
MSIFIRTPGQDDRRPDARQEPADDRPAVVEEERDPDEQREQGEAEATILPEPPEGRRHLHLVQDQVTADNGHDQADEELADTARCTAGTGPLA